MKKFSFVVSVYVEDEGPTPGYDNELYGSRGYQPVLGSRTVAEYIRDAVGSWGGQFHPDDLLFSGNIQRVTAVPIKEK